MAENLNRQTTFGGSLLLSHFNNICEMVYGIHGSQFMALYKPDFIVNQFG
jgi:hypothetical protein